MSDKRRVEGKVAIVTGAGQGMGEAVAKKLSSEGAKLALVDIESSGIAKVAHDIRHLGPLFQKEGEVEVIEIQADVTLSANVLNMVEKVVDRFGTIDILVNNAGVLRPTKLLDIPEDEWDWVIDVNMKGTFLCTQAVIPVMIKQKSGVIVNFSSTAGKNISTAGGIHYTASKAGTLGITRHAAKEVAPYNIRVNAVCPGLIDTPMVRGTLSEEHIKGYEDSFPIPRMGQPEEVADLVAFLVSDESSYITGAALDINGGDLMI